VELYVPAGGLTLEQRSALIKGITDVVLGVIKLPADPARRLYVEIIETAEGGFGVLHSPQTIVWEWVRAETSSAQYAKRTRWAPGPLGLNVLNQGRDPLGQPRLGSQIGVPWSYFYCACIS